MLMLDFEIFFPTHAISNFLSSKRFFSFIYSEWLYANIFFSFSQSNKVVHIV